MGLEQFLIDKIPKKSNFTGFIRSLREERLKHYYTTPALIYCCVIAVVYWRGFKCDYNCTLKNILCVFFKCQNKQLNITD